MRFGGHVERGRALRIHRIAAQLYTAEDPQVLQAGLIRGREAALVSSSSGCPPKGVSQSGRPLMVAAQFARRPRPTVYIVSGEDAADRAMRSLVAYVGLEHVARFPERTDYPWKDTAPDDSVVAARCAALGRIARGEHCIMVTSARALPRSVPPRDRRPWAPTTSAVGGEPPIAADSRRLVGAG